MVHQIQGKAQNYDWGKLGKDSKVAELAAAYPSVQIQPDLPYAEVYLLIVANYRGSYGWELTQLHPQLSMVLKLLQC
jgi:hypothetical protein